MARDDLAKIDGVITATPGGGNYMVELANGKVITAKLSGKMKQFKIRCIVGDVVTIGISAYDLTNGIIMFRQRGAKKPPSGSPSGGNADDASTDS
ncbi:translation initiation factor IF-1 [bacterium]|nr:translation initiation factor IF-1 [bacterium]